MSAPHRYFWQRLPSWLARLLLGSLAVMAVLAGMVGGLALLAQHSADEQASGRYFVEHFSVTMHVLAMTSVAALTVAVVTGLVRLGARVLAAVVLLGSVTGPMTVVAVPARVWLADAGLASGSGDTRGGWHMVVAAALGGLLAAWTWWMTRCLGERSGPTPRRSDSRQRLVLQAVVFVAVTLAGVTAYNHLPIQSNEPAMRAILGWALLAAGIAVVAAFARTAWTSIALLASVAATLGLVFLAYTRIGGWPGVAGWELDGMQSPIITSVASTATLLAAPLVGLLGWGLRQWFVRIHRRVGGPAEALTG